MQILRNLFAITALTVVLAVASHGQQTPTPSPTPVPVASPAPATPAAEAPDPQTDLLKRMTGAYSAGDMANANSLANEFTKQYPDIPEGYLFRSLIRGALKDNEGALADLSKVIELRPNIPSVYINRALARLNSDDQNGALKDLDQVVALKYYREFVYNLRSMVRAGLGDQAGALADLTEAMRLNPHDPTMYPRRARLALKLKDRDRAAADINYLINWYETDPIARPAPPLPAPPAPKTTATPETKPEGLSFQMELNPSVNPSPADDTMKSTIADAYRLRSWLASQNGEHDKALADINKAIKLEPNDAPSYLTRAREYEAKGNLDSALLDANLAVQMDRRSGEFLVERIVLLKLLGRDQEVQPDVDRLLKGDPNWQKTIDDRLAAVKKMLPVPVK